MNGAVVIDSRSTAFTVDALGMRCNDKEQPDPIDDSEEVAGYWLVSHALFTGSASSEVERGGLSNIPTADIATSGTAALAVSASRLLGIVSPNDQAPAVWFAQELTSLQVSTTGSIGLLKKRPGAISVDGGAWSVDLKDVAQLFRRSNRFQSGQEQSLLNALSGRS